MSEAVCHPSIISCRLFLRLWSATYSSRSKQFSQLYLFSKCVIGMCQERKCTPTFSVSDFCTRTYYYSFLHSCLKAQVLLKIFFLLFYWKVWPRGLGFYRDKHVFSSNLFSTNLDCWFHNCSCTSSLLRESQLTWSWSGTLDYFCCPLT